MHDSFNQFYVARVDNGWHGDRLAIWWCDDKKYNWTPLYYDERV